MDDLIYSFLLQSGYPRASIIFDLDLLGSAARQADSLQQPSFAIVDPETAELLAIIDVVDDVDGDTLRETAVATGAFASRLAGRSIQGFVIRVDVRGRTEEEQIQFYRIWPNSTLQQLSSKSFPDLESLRVARKLMVADSGSDSRFTEPAAVTYSGDPDEPESQELPARSGIGLYLPAMVLVVLVLIDSYLNVSRGTSLLSLTQGLLVIGAALLLSLPAALRFLRR